MASANALALGDARLRLARPVCGTLRSQAAFYALSFFWLDGFAVPAPAQVTQSVGQITNNGSKRTFNNSYD
jgi:hypothetical protein